MITNSFQGECLYNFLERQVKDQMRTALGQPLQNISASILNKVVSKDVQANLRKYKMATGRTPNKERLLRSASRGDEFGSPTVRFEGVSGARGRSVGARSTEPDEGLSQNKAIRQYLKDLDTGIGDKVSLMKMLVIRCDEADQSFNRLRNAIHYGETESAER